MNNAAAGNKKNITMGLDLGDHRHTYCVLDKAGKMTSEGSLRNTREQLTSMARSYPGATAVMEAGTHRADLVDVQSAGSSPVGYIHPKAVEVMKEIGINISDHSSNHMSKFLNRKLNTVITVCGNGDQARRHFLAR